ncbi:MAG TPA: M1 family metallopeptidase [Gemmatimonadota bacterium]|nr:M1 family metallopeptidase [Gemmatimonadota bacterium]
MEVRRPARAASAAALLLACALGAAGRARRLAAQDSGGGRAGGSGPGWRVNAAFQRSHDYDLLHQRIALRDFDWDAASVAGEVETVVRSLRPGLDSLVLDAGADLSIDAVTGPDGRSLRHRHAGDTLVVFPAAPAAFGDTLRFRVAYRAAIENGRGLTFLEADDDAPRQVWSQGEAHQNHLWFPTYDFPGDKTTWELSARVPDGFTVVSNGRLEGDRDEGDGTHTVTWLQGHPASTYLVSLVVSRLVRLEDDWRGTPVDYYVYPGDTARARRLFRATPDMIEAYSRMTGVAYPWPKYAQTTVADFFGGMENVTATTLVDWLPDERAWRDDPWYLTDLIPHELAHQWFGDYVTQADWANLWLSEGFAEFMPGQYWGRKRGPAAAAAYYLDEYDRFLQADADRRVPLAAPSSNVIYPKGALVLRMLRTLLGPERFWASVRRYLVDHAYGNATSEDLRRAILDATGENLDWFFDQWVYGAGFPEVSVRARWDSAGGRELLVVRQTQGRGGDSARAAATPAAFRMPVRVRVQTASGPVTRDVVVADAADTMAVDGVGSRPLSVVFDDRDAVVKTLDFPQPTSWLARETAGNGALWNRRWAAERLAGRTDEPAAGKALASVLGGDAPPALRVTAASALAGFPPGRALPALRAALTDSSSRVREAAATALGHVGGEAAVKAVRSAFEGDSSYRVRAAALEAAARADSAHPDRVRELLARGLDTPSYRDVIAHAAMVGMVVRRDTTFLPELEARLDDDPVAAQALGALASAGSARALSLLAAHLGDGRRTRENVLQALTSTVRPGLALPVLRSARAGLEDPEARRAVERTIDGIRKTAKGGGS